MSVHSRTFSSSEGAWQWCWPVHRPSESHNYRPQWRWAKVMFLQASVILSTGGGGGLVPGGGLVLGVSNFSGGGGCGSPIFRGISNFSGGWVSNFLGGLHFLWGVSKFSGRVSKFSPTPPQYGWWVAGTHPTGMHSCFHWCLPFILWSFSLSLGVSKTLKVVTWSFQRHFARFDA